MAVTVKIIDMVPVPMSGARVDEFVTRGTFSNGNQTYEFIGIVKKCNGVKTEWFCVYLNIITPTQNGVNSRIIVGKEDTNLVAEAARQFCGN